MKCKTLMAMGLLACAASLNAAITITIQESGSDVVLNYDGSANLDGVTPVFTTPWSGFQNQLYPSGGQVMNFNGQGYDRYSLNDTPSSYGTSGGPFNADSWSGTTLAIDNGIIMFAQGYQSGDPLSGSMTFSNSDFSTLGLTSGAGYTVTWGSGTNLDSATVTVVPEPEVFALGVGVVCLGLVVFRRRLRSVGPFSRQEAANSLPG